MKTKTLLAFFFLFWTQFCHAQTIAFENIGKENGLLHNYILSIFQDRDGFVWVGTYGGLHRYDGNEMLYFLHDENDSTTISNNVVHAIFQDQKGTLWVGTENGLNQYDPTTLSFTRYYPEKQVTKVNPAPIRSIAQQKDGRIWLGTYGSGLFSFEVPEKDWTHFVHQPANPNSLLGNFVNVLLVDSQDNVCVGTESGGVSILDKAKTSFKNYGKETGFLDNTVASISEEKPDNYWVGTWQGGLNYLDTKTGKISQQSNLNAFISKGKTIRSIWRNDDGTLWLATQNGLVHFDPKSNKTTSYQHVVSNPKSLVFNYVWSLFKDKNNTLWAGTFGGGISKANPFENRFEILNRTNETCNIRNEDIVSILQDSKGRTWAATVGDGLEIYQSSENCLTNNWLKTYFTGQKINVIFEDRSGTIWCEANGVLHQFSQDLRLISSTVLAEQGILGFTIYQIAEDETGNLWMGGWKTGLLKLSASERAKNKDFRFEVINDKKNPALTSDIIWSVFIENNTLWIGTGNELAKLDLSSGKFFKNIPQTGASVFCFFKESENKIWMGTSGKGIFILNPNTNQLAPFKHNDQLANLSILAIGSGNGFLWFSTDGGLFRINLKTEELNKFTKPDGLPDNSFLFHSFAPTKSNRLAFGTAHGIVVANTSTFAINTLKPKAIFSDFKLFGRSVSLEHGSKTERKWAKDLNNLNEINLKYSENVIEIHFSSIQYSATEKTTYSYRLEGFDQTWYKTPAKKRFATYTNLDPGHYIFQLKASNSDGVWGKTSFLKIHISPPWWQTWWFRILLLAFIIGAAYAYFQLRTRRIRLRNKALEFEVNLRTRDLQEANELLKNQNTELSRKSDRILEQQQALLTQKTELETSNVSLESSNNLKNMLFSVIAHDVRNPVNNFLALIQIAKSVATKEIQEILGQAEKQATNLSQMTASLLEWAVFQSQKSELAQEAVHVRTVCEAVSKELLQVSELKKIKIETEVPAHLHVLCDANALQTVIRNLCSNAIKFTPIEGKIELVASLENEKVTISIKDCGTGIEPEKLATIFQFIPNKKTRGTAGELGSGVGLVFSYELNKLNGGEMTVESEPSKGSIFSLTFPYFHKEIAQNDTPLPEITEHEFVPEAELLNTSEYKEVLKGKIVFLVDDDDLHRQNLNSFLCDVVEIYEFANAEEAWKQTQTMVPDLMVIDLNLPGMSGFDLSKLVKSTETTSDITCLILTGETRPEWIAKGFEFGVDAYVTKPYGKKMLLDKITHYFQQQQNRIRRFLMETDVTASSISNNPLNQAFLEKLVQSIEAHLSDSNFNADELCKELGMSRSSLYRKLRSLTNESVNDFIRSVRLKKSLELLKQKQLNVSQIAYEVGFNSLSYFTSSFKKHFGFSPSEVGKGK